MSHSFLPVNPCCTDVVLNSPCGCSSTLPNTGCGQTQCGTNVILSSNVLYNGPVLDCIIAEPCDTLNVILQKIDEIICNLLTQINTLNIQVTNITGQIININSQIININNTLDVCCNVTTTTTTTAPTCSVYNLTTSGPSGFPGDNAWSAIDCYTSLPVDGTITFPTSVNTGCIIDSSLVLGVKVEIIETNACPTTTTTTTGAEECHYYSLQGDTTPGIWIATVCGSEGAPVYVGGELTPGQSEETPCIIPSTLEMYGISIKLDRGVCPTTTTTTTTL